MDFEIGESVKWIVSTIGAVFVFIVGSLGVGKLFELRTTRKYIVQDRNTDTQQTNQVRQIELDQFAFQKFAERLDSVEVELKEIQRQLNSQMVQNARLETENGFLKQTNERQEKEIASLRSKENELVSQVSELTAMVCKLSAEIDELKTKT